MLAATPQAGPLGLLMVILLGVAVAFLGRSLIKHLGRVPASFDDVDDNGRPIARSADVAGTTDPAKRADSMQRADPLGQADGGSRREPPPNRRADAD